MNENGQLVTIFGGSGFVGRYIVRALAKRGYRIRVAVRRPDLAVHLQPLGSVGQIHAVQANLRYPDSVAAAIDGADAVINCVGILFESGRNTFDAVQADGARTIARAAAASSITNFVHLSAIGADGASNADYARTKSEAEEAVIAALLTAVIMRPSIVFGPEDGFFNKFADMAGLAPALPLIGGGETLFQPVYVGDVAEAVALAVDGKATPGAVYELGGPKVASFKTLLELMMAETGRKRFLATVPFPVASLLGKLVGWLPTPPLTADQVELLKTDNVVSGSASEEGRTLEGLGLNPTSMEVILPTYLDKFRKSGQFARMQSS